MLFEKNDKVYHIGTGALVKVLEYLPKDIMTQGLELKGECLYSVIDEDIGEVFEYEESNLYAYQEETLECGNREDCERVESKVLRLAEGYESIEILAGIEDEEDHFDLVLFIYSKSKEDIKNFVEDLKGI